MAIILWVTLWIRVILNRHKIGNTYLLPIIVFLIKIKKQKQLSPQRIN